MKRDIAQKIITHNKQLYDQIAEDFSLTRGYIWPEFEYFKGYLKKNQDVLDLGCGNGRLLELLKDYQPNYLGIDNSKSLITKAKQKWPDNKFQVGDAMDLSSIKQKFDLVFLISTLHHIPSQVLREKVLFNVKEVLKPGGILLMINWNLWQKRYIKYIIKYALLKLTETSKEIIPGVNPRDLDLQDVFIPWQKKHKRYLHALTEHNVSSLLKIEGFEVIKNVSNKRNIITVARKPK